MSAFTRTAAEIITSRKNPRLTALAQLRERAGRSEQCRFLVEGLREITRALDAGAAGARAVFPAPPLLEVCFCPALFKNPRAASALVERAADAGATVQELGESAFAKVSGREGADGLLGVAAAWDLSLERLAGALPPAPLLLVVEAVEKPGNLGALFRVADSAGCAALLCCDPVADIFNPSVVRASQGALFNVPCAIADKTRTAAFLARNGIAVLATSPAASRRYWDADLRAPTAILLGSEKDGLSGFWLNGASATAGSGGATESADGGNGDATAAPAAGIAAMFPSVVPVSIPQRGLSDSLNVATAGAICLFEAVRQRERSVHNGS